MDRHPTAAWTGPRGILPAGRSGVSREVGDPGGEQATVDAVIGGDRDAFRRLVDGEREAVVRSCYRVLGDLSEAEDAAQEAFVIAYRSLATWRGDGPFGAWLGRIAVRVALRSATRRRPVTWRTPTGATGDADPAVDRALERASVAARPTMDPASLAVQAERVAEIRSAVIELREPYREVVALRLFAEASLEDIARETDRSIGTVKNHLHRGLVRLREGLEEGSER